MFELKPFSPLPKIQIQADLQVKAHELTLTFHLHDPEKQVADPLVEGKWRDWARADELWKTTCFEAFFAVPGEPGYWELNLSPAHQKWNLYWFDEYRKPQPPTFCMDFRLFDVRATHDRLDVLLKTELTIKKLEVALCAVVRTAHGISYFALDHGAKPDFHRRVGFLIRL